MPAFRTSFLPRPHPAAAAAWMKTTILAVVAICPGANSLGQRLLVLQLTEEKARNESNHLSSLEIRVSVDLGTADRFPLRTLACARCEFPGYSGVMGLPRSGSGKGQ